MNQRWWSGVVRRELTSPRNTRSSTSTLSSVASRGQAWKLRGGIVGVDVGRWGES
jgi:hypothetical protein